MTSHRQTGIAGHAIPLVLLLFAAACTVRQPGSPAVVRFAVGSAFKAPSFADSASDISVFTQARTGDTVAHLISHLTVAGSLSRAGARLTRDWGPPFHSSDTLLIDPRTLQPASEKLVFNGVRREYHYDGARVTGIIQYPDSAPRSFDKTFDTPVFAFSEVDPLVRSLDYRTGLTMVVPLFSEVDADVEHDTLSVTERTRAFATDAWIVRFADPVIITRYVVDARTRAILDAVTTQRKSGLRFHYASHAYGAREGT